MNQEEWAKLMHDAGWQPIRDLFGNVVEWTLRRGTRTVKISREVAEPFRQLGQAPMPF